MVKVSEDEMKRMNKTSVTLRDGSGYVGYLESLHMLHCVVRMLHQTPYAPRCLPPLLTINRKGSMNPGIRSTIPISKQKMAFPMSTWVSPAVTQRLPLRAK